MTDQIPAPLLGFADHDTNLLIAQLELREVQEYRVNMRTLRNDRPGPPDEELAFDLQIAELEERIAMLQQTGVDAADGHATGDRIDGAQIPHVDEIGKFCSISATKVANNDDADGTDASDTETEADSENAVAILQGLNISVDSMNQDGAGAEGVVPPAVDIVVKNSSAPESSCEACQETFANSTMAVVPCGYSYCHECIGNFSHKDVTLFPPRCCSQSITSEAVSEFLTLELLQKHRLMIEEFETKDKTYCSGAQCSIFLRPANILNDKGTCPECNLVTCTMCKAASHDGTDCPEDVTLQAVLELATELGWQRCPNCQHGVSISTGCNHITYGKLSSYSDYLCLLL